MEWMNNNDKCIELINKKNVGSIYRQITDSKLNNVHRKTFCFIVVFRS